MEHYLKWNLTLDFYSLHCPCGHYPNLTTPQKMDDQKPLSDEHTQHANSVSQAHNTTEKTAAQHK